MFEIDASYIRRFGKNIESQDSEDHIAKVYPHPQDSTENKKPKNNARDDDVVSKALRNAPIKEFSFSFLAGCVTGYATKSAAKLVALVLGLGFIGIQVAQYQGWISIDWADVEEKIVETVDQDMDGKFTVKDLEIIWQRAKRILIKHVPKSTAFLSGFLLGFYRG